MPSVLSPLRPLRRARLISSAAQCGPSSENSATGAVGRTSGAGRLARSERAAPCLGPVCARASGLLWHAWVPGHSVVKPSPKPEHNVSMVSVTEALKQALFVGVRVTKGRYALAFLRASRIWREENRNGRVACGRPPIR